MAVIRQLPRIEPLGDDALLMTFADAISWDVSARIRSAAAQVRGMSIEAVTDVVPAYTTLAVYFDSARVSHESLASSLSPLLSATGRGADQDAALIEIPIVYDGPDLAEVAARTGLTIEAVIERHSSRTYRAYVAGFVPGFAYLGDLDESLVLPRRATPRVRVPRGSVAIADAQTAVYPLETPGGWHLIGTTTAVMFDPSRDPPALISPGDTVRFVKAAR
jgi:KipI family sensor histidine kinase inhibitor